MGEGREALLKTDLEIKENAKRKSKIVGIVASVFVTIFFITMMLMSETSKENLTPVMMSLLMFYIFIITVIIFSTKCIFPLAFEQSEYAKRSIAYTNVSLPAETFVEVKLNPNKNTDFILNLQDIAKFYAIIREEDNLVEIYIKFNFEEKTRKYEDVGKEYFYDYYSVQEEK